MTRREQFNELIESLPLGGRLAFNILSDPRYVVAAIALFLTWTVATQSPKIATIVAKLDAYEAARSRDVQLGEAMAYAECLNVADLVVDDGRRSVALARCAVAADGALTARRPK
jgi:hypothetical protein